MRPGTVEEVNCCSRSYPLVRILYLELCGVVLALQSWKHSLLGKRFLVEIDYKNLLYIILYIARSENTHVHFWVNLIVTLGVPGESPPSPD